MEITTNPGKKLSLNFLIGSIAGVFLLLAPAMAQDASAPDYSSYFSWEANDWNFEGGQYINDPGIHYSDTPNYFDNKSIQGIDHDGAHETREAPGNDMYRLGAPVGTEVAADDSREPWASDTRPHAVQYSVGWLHPGDWLNYTRDFPEGEYYVYARLAYGSSGRFGSEGSFGAQLDRVTSDPAQPNQTTEKLGTFRKDSNTGGWQNFEFIPLMDDRGSMTSIRLNGVETLRVTVVDNTYNANYYMLVPVEAFTQ